MDLSLQRPHTMPVDVSPRSHIETPAWQSFELRMRVRAAERRAARRKRRIRCATATVFAAGLSAGGLIGIQQLAEFAKRTAEAPISWPALPLAPSLPIPASVAPLPIPSNWDVVVDAPAFEPEQPPEVASVSTRPEPIRETRPAPPKTEPRPPLTTARTSLADERPRVTPARPAPRTIEWPPPPREAPRPTPMEPVHIAEPPPPPETTSTPPATTTFTPPESPAVAPPRVDPRESVRSAIERYRSAYQRLDASAARAVWPGVDAGALARAFGALAAQELSFDSCAITVSGPSADASCAGRSRVIPKIGGGSESARRTWQFKLRQAGNGWVIEQAKVR